MKVSIHKPCSEQYDQMSPREGGRFCSLCAQCVIDFRDKKPQEILDYLSNNPNTCGVFKPKQVSESSPPRALVTPYKWKALGLTALVTLGLKAQQNPQTDQEIRLTETEIILNPKCEEITKPKNNMGCRIPLKSNTNPTYQTPDRENLDSLELVSGTLVDSDGFPLSDYTIRIKGEKENAVISDLEGNFSLRTKIGDIIDIEEDTWVIKSVEVNQKELGRIVIQSSFQKIIMGMAGISSCRTQSNKSNIGFYLSYPYRKIKQWIETIKTTPLQ